MRDFATLGKRKAVLGMIHLQPLPGTPFIKKVALIRFLKSLSNRHVPSIAEGRMAVWCRL